jgi:hypothetical protein
MNSSTPADMGPQTASDRPPFVLRGADNDPEWYCIVAGRTFGPWPKKGAAAAGFATEQRRAAARQTKPGS